MEKTNEEKVVIEEDDIKDFEEPESTLDDTGEDTTDWKAEALKRDGMARRFQTKLKKIKELEDAEAKAEAEEAKKQPQDKKDFDYAELSYLAVKEIESDEEIAFTKKWMEDTGKSLKEVINNKMFKAELKEKREEAASKEAIPTGTKRAGNATRDSVEYWIAKGELPPADQKQLRRDVINARYKTEGDQSKFTDTPVVT